MDALVTQAPRPREGHLSVDGAFEPTMPPDLPHTCVYARLGLSPIHGIGVFAIKPIPAGTNVFANDRVELVWIEKEALDRAGLLTTERKFYDDFGITRGSQIGCPVNFHNLTPGWYCNEPAEGEASNIDVDAEFNFRASREIAQGEELTVHYSDFSQAPE